MENRRKSLRFGLMINSLTVEHWQYETIKLLMENGMKLSLIIQNSDNTPAPSFLNKIKDYPFRRILFRLWNRFIFNPRSKYPADLTDLTADIHTIFCKPKIKGISTYFEEIDIQEIRNQNLDFILRFGFDIVRGEVLNTAKYGVWSFHHDDERIIRGGPPGFWEFMKRIPSNGVILQRLTNSLDKGIILKRIQFKTILHSYKANTAKPSGSAPAKSIVKFSIVELRLIEYSFWNIECASTPIEPAASTSGQVETNLSGNWRFHQISHRPLFASFGYSKR